MDPSSASRSGRAVRRRSRRAAGHPLGRGRRQGCDRQDDAGGPDRRSAAWVGGGAHRRFRPAGRTGLGAGPVRPAGAAAAARRATGSISALGLRPQRGRRVAHRPDRGAGRCGGGIGHRRTAGCSVGLHDLGRGAVRGPAGASHGAGWSGADGPLAERLDAERGRVRGGSATSGSGRPRVPAAGYAPEPVEGPRWSFDRLAAWRRSRSKARSSRSTATR